MFAAPNTEPVYGTPNFIASNFQIQASEIELSSQPAFPLSSYNSTAFIFMTRSLEESMKISNFQQHNDT